MTAAVTFFERHQPATFEEAAGLLESYGRGAPQAFDAAASAWDMYWHRRDMPCD